MSDDAVLHYIDQVSAGMTRAYERAQRALWLATVLALVLLALSSGVVSADEEVTISGLKFRLALWVFLCSGAVLLLPLVLSFAFQTAHARRLRDEIVQLYRTVDFHHAGMTDRLRSPFQPSAIGPALAALFARGHERPRGLLLLYSGVVATSAVGAVLLLPLLAQVAVLIAVADTYGWQLGVWLPLVILISVTALAVPAALLGRRSAHQVRPSGHEDLPRPL